MIQLEITFHFPTIYKTLEETKINIYPAVPGLQKSPLSLFFLSRKVILTKLDIIVLEIWKIKR